MKEIKISSSKLSELFHQIGGESRLETILVDFYERMSKDVLVGFFFDGRSHEQLREIAQKQKSFLMRAWGVSPSYAGKAPADAHTMLAPILAGHFDRRLRILEDTLRAFGLSEDQIVLWSSFEAKFRQAVVNG